MVSPEIFRFHFVAAVLVDTERSSELFSKDFAKSTKAHRIIVELMPCDKRFRDVNAGREFLGSNDDPPTIALSTIKVIFFF